MEGRSGFYSKTRGKSLSCSKQVNIHDLCFQWLSLAAGTKSESGRPGGRGSLEVGAQGCSAEVVRGRSRFCLEGQQAGLVAGLQGGGKENRESLGVSAERMADGSGVYRERDMGRRRNRFSGSGQTSPCFVLIATRPVAR